MGVSHSHVFYFLTKNRICEVECADGMLPLFFWVCLCIDEEFR
jgi:hypothetical protein